MSYSGYIHIDPKVLESLLSVSKNKSLGHELVEIFSQDAKTLIESFRHAFRHQDEKALRYLTHRMKGSCLNVGASKLHKACDTLEELSQKQASWQELSPIIEKMEEHLSDCMQEFHKLLNSN